MTACSRSKIPRIVFTLGDRTLTPYLLADRPLRGSDATPEELANPVRQGKHDRLLVREQQAGNARIIDLPEPMTLDPDDPNFSPDEPTRFRQLLLIDKDAVCLEHRAREGGLDKTLKRRCWAKRLLTTERWVHWVKTQVPGLSAVRQCNAKKTSSSSSSSHTSPRRGAASPKADASPVMKLPSIQPPSPRRRSNAGRHAPPSPLSTPSSPCTLPPPLPPSPNAARIPQFQFPPLFHLQAPPTPEQCAALQAPVPSPMSPSTCPVSPSPAGPVSVEEYQEYNANSPGRQVMSAPATCSSELHAGMRRRPSTGAPSIVVAAPRCSPASPRQLLQQPLLPLKTSPEFSMCNSSTLTDTDSAFTSEFSEFDLDEEDDEMMPDFVAMSLVDSKVLK